MRVFVELDFVVPLSGMAEGKHDSVPYQMDCCIRRRCGIGILWRPKSRPDDSDSKIVNIRVRDGLTNDFIVSKM